MPRYSAPLAEFRFLLEEVFDYEKDVTSLPGLADATMDTVLAVLEHAGRFVSEKVLPLNLPGDMHGCRKDEAGGPTIRESCDE